MKNNNKKLAVPKWNSYFLFLIFVTITFGDANSQNLISNSSFENLTSCPEWSNGCAITLAIPWQQALNGQGQSDLNNSCAPTSHCSAPEAYIANGVQHFQWPHTGNGFADIFLYDAEALNLRQYLCAPLLNNLSANRQYYVEYYINLINYAPYGVNNLSGIFTASRPASTGSLGLVEADADIFGYGNPVILDTLGWVKIGGIYTADGTENWFSLGNFQDDDHTITITAPGGIQFYSTAYEFDDISVIPLDSFLLPADAGPDTTIIQGDSAFIGSYINGLICTWYNEAGQVINTVAPGFYVAPTTSTWYALKQEVAGQTAYDTVNVFVIPLGIHAAQLDEVKLWPNPTAGTLHVSLPAGAKGSYRLSVRAIDGRLVAAASPAAGVREVQLELAAAGVYFATIEEMGSGEKVVRKIVVER